jgi:hypothetical protein
MGGDVFRRGIQSACYQTVRLLRPVAGEDIVGATAKQQIETLSLRRDDRV